jgi:hypothetical protein
MIQREKVSPFLSPPTSPRMSGIPPGQFHANWQDPPPPSQRIVIQSSKPRSQSSNPVKEEVPQRPTPSNDARPSLLRSHKSSPYTTGPGAYNAPHQQSPLSRTPIPGNPEPGEDVNLSHSRYADFNRSDLVLSYQGESAPPSPTSIDADLEDFNEEAEDEAGITMSDDVDEDAPTEGEGEKTAAERRAEKRKMKRFRYVLHCRRRRDHSNTPPQSNPQSNSIFDERIHSASPP